jgi:hypothetical protein
MSAKLRSRRKKTPAKPRKRAAPFKRPSVKKHHVNLEGELLASDPFTVSFLKGLTAQLRADPSGRPDLSVWDEIQLRPVSPTPELTDLPDDDAKEAIKSWFFENFEDPVENTPYEGEYIYIWGGPYQASDIIQSAFAAAAPERIVDRAIEEIEAQGRAWAPNAARGEQPYEPSEDTHYPDARFLHAIMLQRIETLERALAKLEGPRRGIGDNNPPEPIEFDGFTPADRRQIKAAIAVLKKQPPEPETEPKDAEEAARALQRIANRLARTAAAAAQYVGKQADKFISAAAEEAGKRAIQSPLWLTIITKISAVADAAVHWLSSFPFHF